MPPLTYWLSYALDYDHYRYSNASGSFTQIDLNSNNLSGISSSFDHFLSVNQVPPQDAILYRTFWRNPLAFWRYWRYWGYGHEKYNLPYRSWWTIKAARVKKLIDNPNADTLQRFQDF